MLLSWQNAAAGRNTDQQLENHNTLADYMYGDGECITVDVSNNF
jgi:hypothetical protein